MNALQLADNIHISHKETL